MTIFDYYTVLVKKSSDNMLGQSEQLGAKVRNSISSIDTSTHLPQTEEKHRIRRWRKSPNNKHKRLRS